MRAFAHEACFYLSPSSHIQTDILHKTSERVNREREREIGAGRLFERAGDRKGDLRV